MKNVLWIIFMSISAMAAEKPQWQSGCENAFQQKVQEMVARGIMPLEPSARDQWVKDRCERVKETINWSAAKDNKFLGCADAVNYLLDGGKITDFQQRKSMIVNYCM